MAFFISSQTYAEEWVITEEDLFAEVDSVSGVTHMRQELQQVPAAVTIIDRRMIESSTAVSLVDLFRLVPGFQVYFHHANKPGVAYHAPGGEYSRRLEVKIDGRSVYEPLLSSVEWNTIGIDLDDVDYIEIIRGSNNSADGSNAFLASINIVTRSVLSEAGTKTNLHYGNKGIQGGAISHSSQVGQLASRATLRVKKNNGFDDYYDEPSDAKIEIDDGAETFTLSYQGLWTPTITDSIDFQLGIGQTDTTIGHKDYFERQWDSQYQYVEWKRIVNNWSDFELLVYHNSIDFIDHARPWTVANVLGYWGANENGKSLARDVVLTPQTQAVLMTEPNQERFIVKPSYAHFSDRWDAEIRSNIYRRDDLRMNLGLASRHDSLKSDLFLGQAGKLSQISNRLYANAEWTASDNLTLNYGQILEKKRHQASTNSFRVAVNYQFSEQHVFRLAASQSYREPTILEANQNSSYFYNDISINTPVRADNDIASEKLTSHEIGYLGSFLENKLNFDIRLFNEDLTHLIAERRELFDGDTQDIINIIDNTGYMTLTGLEWQLKYRPTNQLLLNLNHSYIDADGEVFYASYIENNDGYLQLDDVRSINECVPTDMINVLVSYQADNNLTLSGSFHYKSGYKNSPKYIETAPGYSRVDLKASKRWYQKNNWLELSFAVQNMGDDYSEHHTFNRFKTQYIIGFKVNSH